MSWLTEQFNDLRDFLRTDFRRILLYCTLGMLLTAVLGVAAGAMAPEAANAVIENFMAHVQESGVVDKTGNISLFALLTNNWTAMLVSALYGFIPFLFLPLFSLFINGSLLGMVAMVYHINGMSVQMYLAGILPHGIFELPALVLSVACGICLCRNMCRIVTGSERRVPLAELLSNLLRVMLFIVLPLTLMAAVMECYVTPLVMWLFM